MLQVEEPGGNQPDTTGLTSDPAPKPAGRGRARTGSGTAPQWAAAVGRGEGADTGSRQDAKLWPQAAVTATQPPCDCTSCHQPEPLEKGLQGPFC